MKNFKRAIETHGLRAQYNGGADFSLQARMIPAALAFVPAEDLVRAFEDLSDTRMTLTSLNLIYIIIAINLKKNCVRLSSRKKTDAPNCSIPDADILYCSFLLVQCVCVRYAKFRTKSITGNTCFGFVGSSFITKL